MRMTFKVRYEDGREVEAVAKPKDIVAFERQYGVSLQDFGGWTFTSREGAQHAKAAPFEWLCYLAWSPLHRQGREPLAFDDFLDNVDDVEEVEEEEAQAPFLPEASTDSSPDSASTQDLPQAS